MPKLDPIGKHHPLPSARSVRTPIEDEEEDTRVTNNTSRSISLSGELVLVRTLHIES